LRKIIALCLLIIMVSSNSYLYISPVLAVNSAAIRSIDVHPSFHLRATASSLVPNGLSPSQIRSVYNLPDTGGRGTIAIVDAYDDPTVANDLDMFSIQFNLPLTSSGYFVKHKMSPFIQTNSNWALEVSLDVQWAHAIAPDANILLVEAKTSSLVDLLAAVDYARSQPDVVAVSMSWAGAEFSDESSYDPYFSSNNGGVMAFFAASGDRGAGVNWPAVSPNVIGVGGTTLVLNPDGSVASETAWSGSGGGVSAYVAEPLYQLSYGVSGTNDRRCVPDVSYNGDPSTGFTVYDSTPYGGQVGWFTVGGTSAGPPQWAAIYSLGLSALNTVLYSDAGSSSASSYFRDITTGTNGLYSATTGFDYVTGLGSPLTKDFVPSSIQFTTRGIGADATGAVLTIDGEAYAYTQLPVTFEWPLGSNHLVTASAPVPVDSGKRYTWVDWENGGGLTGSSGTYIVPDSSQTVISGYVTQHQVSLLVDPPEAGSVTPSSGWFDEGATISISPAPNPGFVFSSLNSNPTESITFSGNDATIHGACEITAYFTPSYSMIIDVLNGGSGYTTPHISLEGGGGSGATATVRVSNGVIVGIVVTSLGNGYTSAPTINIIDPSPRASGGAATATYLSG
jgi:subtilase family serine protease